MTPTDLIQWADATLSWTPAGYRLELDVWIDERASALFEVRLEETLQPFDALDDGDLRVTFVPAALLDVAEDGRRSTDHEPAELEVVAPRTLFAIDPVAFRAALDELAVSCQQEADEQHARDEELARQWLRRLRGTRG